MSDTPAPDAADGIAELIATMIAERGADKTVCPSEVARAIAGPDETKWRLLMHPIRVEAVKMAKAGALTIRRKGRVVDPDGFKGIYRLGAASESAAAPEEIDEAGAGNSASVRPLSQ
ncbi:DUF3253 domain-containing protein [Aureimonas glaciei]|uniref:DUF3253 domain-containing protein n=1 Tax=Aureimonas glaciei TaxID=1776957 RepID=A0A917DHI4_9HYPH|nr:DUF3253 domain-containing protein [Aureimonas glaciei]GGD39194.1 hypothetical protein GCM10011335_47450 [Aureimonas glaciei]